MVKERKRNQDKDKDKNRRGGGEGKRYSLGTTPTAPTTPPKEQSNPFAAYLQKFGNEHGNEHGNKHDRRLLPLSLIDMSILVSEVQILVRDARFKYLRQYASASAIAKREKQREEQEEEQEEEEEEHEEEEEEENVDHQYVTLAQWRSLLINAAKRRPSGVQRVLLQAKKLQAQRHCFLLLLQGYASEVCMCEI
jgi:hypothetical protein